MFCIGVVWHLFHMLVSVPLSPKDLKCVDLQSCFQNPGVPIKEGEETGHWLLAALAEFWGLFSLIGITLASLQA